MSPGMWGWVGVAAVVAAADGAAFYLDRRSMSDEAAVHPGSIAVVVGVAVHLILHNRVRRAS